MLRNRIRNTAKKSKPIASIYRLLRLLQNMPLKDYFDFDKIRLFLKVKPHTQVTYKGLLNVYDLSNEMENHKIEGSFVECGVWRGGCIAVMAFVAHRARSDRKIWLLDSFEGMPEASIEDGPEGWELSKNRSGGNLVCVGTNVAAIEEVDELLFKTLLLDRNNIIFEKGWFQDTLPKVKNRIGPIAILRLDGDWYESTKVCLANLYDKVVSGGYVIIDDYGHFPGCRRAVAEFLTSRNIDVRLNEVDYTVRYFQKSRE